MSVKPVEFLNSANEYAETNKEINKRNAISRSFYACYHVATQNFPIEPGFQSTNPKAGTHAKYIEYLSSFPNGSKQRLLGLNLKKLLVRRRMADYDIDLELKKSDLALQLSVSRDIFKSFEIS